MFRVWAGFGEADCGCRADAACLIHHGADLWQNLPVLVVVLWGGFTTNFIWCVILLARNRSANQLAGAPAAGRK